MSCILCAWSKNTLLCHLWPEPPVESEQQWAPHWCVICRGSRSTIGRWLRNVYPLFRASLLLTADRSGGQKSHPRRAIVLPLNRGVQSGKRARCNGPVASDLKEPSKKFWCEAEEFFRRGLLLGELLQVCLFLEPLPTKSIGSIQKHANNLGFKLCCSSVIHKVKQTEEEDTEKQ